MKPAGLLQTPIASKRFQTIAVDQFKIITENEFRNWWIYYGKCDFEMGRVIPFGICYCYRTDEVTNDLRAVVDAENYVAEITPNLKRFTTVIKKSREQLLETQLELIFSEPMPGRLSGSEGGVSASFWIGT